MIRHIVFFSAKRDCDIDAIVGGLSILAQIPHVRRFEVAKNRKTDPLSAEVDIVVYGEFEDEAALHAYKAHPLYENRSSASGRCESFESPHTMTSTTPAVFPEQPFQATFGK